MSLQTMYPAEQQRLQQQQPQYQRQQHEIIGCCALCIRILEWLGIMATQGQQQQQHVWHNRRGQYVQGGQRNSVDGVGEDQRVDNTVNMQPNRAAQQCQEQDMLLPQKGESSSTPLQPQTVQPQQTGLPDLETMRRRAAHKRAGSKGSTKGKSGNIKDDQVDDCCPTCLDPYDEDNPKILTSCGHHFHLACIYEWLNRSDNCPMCGQKMKFDELL
eukprot:TRINITY_DN18343_c0_g1_i2.p2 TRINITY_DN18343_c0_g1~~TRINITY_DN18343_c0_g1_i2.p2  ORF type:complete len:215 (+),score=32.16 TRINITY_DN18343_c0_g1_i2:103-747(+)